MWCWILDQWDCNKISWFSLLNLLETNLDLHGSDCVWLYYTITLQVLMARSNILTHTRFYVLTVYILLRHYRLCLHLIPCQDTLYFDMKYYLIFFLLITVPLSIQPCQKNYIHSPNFKTLLCIPSHHSFKRILLEYKSTTLYILYVSGGCSCIQMPKWVVARVLLCKFCIVEHICLYSYFLLFACMQ